MKTSTKFICGIIALIFLALGMQSCNDDDEYLFYSSIATANLDEDGYAESFILDDGRSLFVASAGTNYKPKNERVIINYDILEEEKPGYTHAIHLIDYWADILTKPIIYVPNDNEHLQDSIGDNKIKVFAVWVASDYINFKFGYNTTTNSKHMINLVTDVNSFEQQGDEPIKLQFRHKVVEGEEHYASGEILAAFKLDDYIKANPDKKELIFDITWEEYSGSVKTETVKYSIQPTEVLPD